MYICVVWFLFVKLFKEVVFIVKYDLSFIYNKYSFWRCCYCISKVVEFRFGDFEKKDLFLVDKYIVL